MSMYGPPGGGPPGQPQDPWQGGSGDPYGGQPGGDPYGGQASSPFGGGDPYGQPPSDPYGQPPGGVPGGAPADPYGQPSGPPDPYGGQPGVPGADQWGAPPPSGPPGQPPGGQWGAPPPPSGGGGSNTGMIIGIVAGVLVLLCLCGVGGLVWLANTEDDDSPSANPPTTAAPTSASPSPSESPTPTDSPTKTDINDAEEGDCLYDSDPSNTSATLSYVSCSERGEDHYEVLKRYDDTTDADKCKGVDGYDTSFTSKSGNFVLCVRELN